MDAVVLIAGPSSSGKTTFAANLCTALEGCVCVPHPPPASFCVDADVLLLPPVVAVVGTKTFMLSTDNYYKNKTQPDHPRDESGKPDFEDIQAIRLDILNRHLTQVEIILPPDHSIIVETHTHTHTHTYTHKQFLAGEAVSIPDFDFVNSCYNDHTPPRKMPADAVIVMEGLFCLNPLMTAAVPQVRHPPFFQPRCACAHSPACHSSAGPTLQGLPLTLSPTVSLPLSYVQSVRGGGLHIYISPLCQLNIDDEDYLSNQIVRIIRRIARDFLHRGRDACATLLKASFTPSPPSPSLLLTR